MSKRRNENGQMRREDYEAADDNDSSGENGSCFDGGFQRAPEAAIARRKIVTARVGGKKATPTATPVSAAPVATSALKTSAFAGFQGLVAPEPPARTNPFAGFSGLTGAAPAAQTASLVQPTPVAPVANATSKTPSTYQEAIEVLNKDFLDFVTQQKIKNPSSDWTAAAEEYAKYAEEISVKFASTKPVAGSAAASAIAAARPITAPTVSSVPSFVADKKESPPLSGFSFGARKDEKTASSGFSFGAKKDETPPSSGFAFGSKKDETTATSGFSFGAKKDESPAPKTSNGFSFGGASPAKPVTGGFSFGSAPPSATPTKPDSAEKAAPKPASSLFSFSAKPAEDKPIPAFSFGAPPKPAESTEKPKASTGGFSFGSAPAASSSTAGGFSFGASKPAAATPATTSGFSFNLSTTPAAPSSTAPAAEEDDDEENIGREEATVILKSDNTDDDCLFEVEKAKVLEFKKDEKRWADKGTHPLQVLVNKTTKNARILVRNEIGKIVLNSALYKGLAIKPHEAKGKKTGALLTLQVDATLTQFILKVNIEKVDAFLTALDKATPK